jgi:hypothetical protein
MIYAPRVKKIKTTKKQPLAKPTEKTTERRRRTSKIADLRKKT